MKHSAIALFVVASIGISFAALDPLRISKQRGKKVYEMYCLPCHMEDGGGVPRMNPPLVKTSYVLGDKKALINIVLKGMDEPIEIDGETYTNVMAPHDFLKDQEIADVLTYVRNSFGNKASLVTVAEVKAVRAAKK
jgi:mono/diheme cytochrome c family protein